MFGKKEPAATEEHFRKWAQIRVRGEVYFVLTRGIFVAVACEIIGFLVISAWYEHKHFDNLWDYIIGNGIGWVFAGFFGGISEWASNEKRYQREMMQFSSSNFESPEQTLKQLQRGMENGK